MSYRAPERLRFVSTVSGGPVVEEIARAEYWVEQVRREVRFADAVRSLHAEGVETFVEIGPDGVLSAMGQGVVPSGVFVPSVRRDRDECVSVLSALAHTHLRRSTSVNWTSFFAGSGARHIDLPVYPFQRRRFWIEASGAVSGEPAALGLES
ncbi:acyltransferase domain-containing protein, partial [Streptomyces sp. BK79]|uniref:acyltransferase domain-containing protein n=1 Tax=Streptomyces sp. BK79 TaxID=3350097 RepID=UPI00376FAB52